jgi:integrin alpha FG-GAP repeat containing protein 1
MMRFSCPLLVLIFLIEVLNSLCLKNCIKPVNVTADPYGVNYAGACIKFGVTDTHGNAKIVESCQLPQQAYNNLLSSNSVLGIGRTNNYIEELFIGVTTHEENHVAVYQGIIPNSVIVVSPHDQSLHRDSSSYICTNHRWQLELYMNPSSTSFAIILILSVTLGLLGLVIFILDCWERREDDIERRSRLHTINFDAL